MKHQFIEIYIKKKIIYEFKLYFYKINIISLIFSQSIFYFKFFILFIKNIKNEIQDGNIHNALKIYMFFQIYKLFIIFHIHFLKHNFYS